MDQGLEAWETAMFFLMVAAYLLSCLTYWLWLGFKQEFLGKLATFMTLAGLAGQEKSGSG